MDTMDRSPVTNQRVGEDLGVSHSMISRIRSGDRQPSMGLAAEISIQFDWTLDDQAKAMRAGNYAALFEQRLATRYAVQ